MNHQSGKVDSAKAENDDQGSGPASGSRSQDSLCTQTFADLYAAHLKQVRLFFARAGCERHSIDDLAQETFLRAWNGRSHFSGNVQFRTWLLGIARNTARESWRRKINTQSLDMESLQKVLARASVDVEATQAVRQAVSRLPPKQRTAISLVYLDGLTQIDAASKTACANDAFRQRLALGRLRLRALLNDDHAV